MRISVAGPRRGSRLFLVVVVLIAFGSGCRRSEQRPETAPAATATRAPIAAAARAVPELEPTWTPEPPPPPRAETPRVAASLPAELLTMRPTIDVGTIPNFDRPRDPTPAGRTEQLAHCLTFSAEALSQPGYSGAAKMRARVRARNTCNLWIPSEDSWFEIVSTSAASGGTIGREVGRFQAPIPPRSTDTETMIEVDCPNNLPGGCHFAVSVWWAAGGGRNPE